ncbi:SagB-type dehydrogenase domain protein [Pyrolobus fumarii 1A]|uniref:SagB-type dehydrogenase domain protein n=1 Tax=Pyrolobus fumarii (strain DSM 11204 / 1A) TaxID=694429 RepID=G0ED98_PYRF1|nr:SagB-type dehydrogenase domain protein [Pyrolobus fumarii 1A]
MLARGLSVLCETRDPGLALQESTAIERWGYYGEPRPEFPGFFKRLACAARVRLPEPLGASGVDVLEAIRRRESRREYGDMPVSLEQLSTLLFYAAGVRGYELGWPLRTYPSAGGLQPVEVYVNAWSVEGLEPGLYHYDAERHELCLLGEPIPRDRLASICLDQEHAGDGSLALIITAVYARTASKYGARGYRYIHLDAGAVVQNVYLVTEALGLATVVIGAFYDHELCNELGIDCRWELPMAVMPVGTRP